MVGSLTVKNSGCVINFMPLVLLLLCRRRRRRRFFRCDFSYETSLENTSRICVLFVCEEAVALCIAHLWTVHRREEYPSVVLCGTNHMPTKTVRVPAARTQAAFLPRVNLLTTLSCIYIYIYSVAL